MITDMLVSLGFDDKWVDWMARILSSASSSILLNGVPGKQFSRKRGDQTGDPLSPLLFVLAVDLLQDIVNKATNLGILSKPILDRYTQDFPIV